MNEEGPRASRLSSLWFVTTGEPLPTDGPGTRLLRTGIFFQDLVERGVETRWWTSGFDHHGRRHRTRRVAHVPGGAGGTITLIPSPGYGASVSPRRLWDHRVTAWRFRRMAAEVPAPDLIWCSYPTIALASAAVEVGRARGVPVVLDVRDLWPDVIWDTVLPWAGGAVRDLGLVAPRRRAARALARATALVGLTDAYVAWALALAGRGPTLHDRAIPVTCPDEGEPTAAELAEGERFWRAAGVDLGRHWVVCFLGTLGRQFDFRPVVEAASVLGESAPEVRFVLAGDGEGARTLRESAARLSNVVVPGWIDGAPRRALLARAKAGLGPYRPSENFARNLPNKPVEYMAYGLPVLYPLGGVLDQVCGSAGCGVRYGGEGRPSLAAAVLALREDRGRLVTMGQAARRLFEDRYTRESATRSLVALCDGILGGA